MSGRHPVIWCYNGEKTRPIQVHGEMAITWSEPLLNVSLNDEKCPERAFILANWIQIDTAACVHVREELIYIATNKEIAN